MPALHRNPTQPMTHSGPFAPNPGATHQTAADVSAALAAGRAVGLTPMRFLPLWAQVAFTRVVQNPEHRHGDRLDALLQSYAELYTHTVDLETCAAMHRICGAEWSEFVRTVKLPEVKA